MRPYCAHFFVCLFNNELTLGSRENAAWRWVIIRSNTGHSSERGCFLWGWHGYLGAHHSRNVDSAQGARLI